MKIRKVFTITVIAFSAIFLISPAYATVFSFNANNQFWQNAGLYDDGSLTPIPGWFGTNAANWFDNGIYGDPHGGVLLLGSGGFTFPDSPSGNQYLHWDLNSPDLSGEAQWQGISSFSYEVNGEDIAIIGESYVEAVVKVLKPDLTESYYTDNVFHQLYGSLSQSPTPWTTFSLDVTNLGIPAGSTIEMVNLRFFFEAGSPNGHDGFFLVDNVTPVAGGGGAVPEPMTILLYGLGFAGAGVYRRMRKKN